MIVINSVLCLFVASRAENERPAIARVVLFATSQAEGHSEVTGSGQIPLIRTYTVYTGHSVIACFMNTRSTVYINVRLACSAVV